MAYFAPYIDATGIHIPAYTDIVDSLVSSAQSIFGSDIYLGIDSQDYQFISTFANMVNDSNLLLQSVYNARSPATAIGVGLDGVVAINGISRRAGTYSTATVTISGTAGTSITGGIIQDLNGNNWALPSPTIIGTSGTVSTLATCQAVGAIAANANTITIIATPTLGWASVTNPSPAVVGIQQETDSVLRSRQAISAAQSSQTILEGIQGAIAGVSGVTRFKAYNNDTGTADSNGVPAHSICCVVEGGNALSVATAIWEHKGPGCGTYGTSAINVTDSYGVVTPINYDVASYEQIIVAITVKQLTGYSTDTTAAIEAAINSYINNLPIGATCYISGIWGAALTVNVNPSLPTFSVTSVQASVSGGTLGSTDIPVPFNEATQITTSNITITTI